MKNLNNFKDLDIIKVGDKREVYDFKCVCTYKSNDFITFKTLLKNGKIGKKNTSFLKYEFAPDVYKWKNVHKTSTKFVNK